ncbi:VOC family protein [Parasphingopyxis sp.]|uniref:VOC family protein n=1 Tax=Parasphingopyxis sp. TaxID=1920299 RepID=UPI002636C630|nr:VOC family protein [Parasphingopyxis sp.]
MHLGNFSLSLAVKDIAASRTFYEALGFGVMHDQSEHGWMILQSPGCTIGLFQGMFEDNILTFNPGWDEKGEPVGDFTDIREIQKRLKAAGIAMIQEADETTTGPASCVFTDPDGNQIMLDQHV